MHRAYLFIRTMNEDRNMKYEDKVGGAILTLNEYELHNIIAGLSNLGPDNDHVDTIVIKPTNPIDCTPELVKKSESGFNAFLKSIHGMDKQFHEDADQTCG